MDKYIITSGGKSISNPTPKDQKLYNYVKQLANKKFKSPPVPTIQKN